MEDRKILHSREISLIEGEFLLVPAVSVLGILIVCLLALLQLFHWF